MDTKGSALVVDDDEDVRTLITMILTRAGYTATSVDGGRPALALAQQYGSPSVYVVDVRMPEMSGHELCRQLKAEARTQGPVLLVSAQTSDEDIAAAFAAGCDDFLPKPFNARELLERIETLLRLSG